MAGGGETPHAMRLQSVQEMDAVTSMTEHKDFSLHENCQELVKLQQSVNNPVDNLLVQQLRILLASKYTENLQPSERPTSEFYDAVIVFAQLDIKMAIEIMNFMNRIDLKKNEHPKVCLFDKAEFGGSEIKLPQTLIDRCSLIFPLVTDNFEHDKDVQFLNEETVAETRLGDVKQGQQYCVRPLHSKPKKERKYKAPFGLASIQSYDVFDFNDEHTISKFKDLFEHSLSIRKNREKESKRARHGTPNMNADQAQTNAQSSEDGQTFDLHNPDGRQSLPDGKAMQTYSENVTSVQKKCRSPTSSLVPAAAPCSNGFESAVGSINRLSDHNSQREGEEPSSIPGTHLLSELGLLNDFGTMRKPYGADVTTDNAISVDLKQGPKMMMHGNGSHKSEVLKKKENILDEQTTPLLTPDSKTAYQSELKKLSANDNPNIVEVTHNTVYTKSDSPKEDQEQERHSSMEAEFGIKSLSAETREKITEGMLRAALKNNTDEDVEGEDQPFTKVHCVGLESHELTGNHINGKFDGCTKLVNGEVDHVSADTSAEFTACPDMTRIQSLSSKGECTFNSMQKEMSLCQDSSQDDQESIIEEVSPDEQISTASQNNDGVTESNKVAQYTYNDQYNTVINLPLGSDYPEKMKRNDTITELVMRGGEPAYSKCPGLCSSPESEYMQFANAFSPGNGTFPKNSMTGDQKNEEEKKSKSAHSSGHGRPSDGNPDKLDGTQLPVESAGKTFVYIYNSSDIRIQGENNIHMEDNKSESQGEQKTNVKKEKKKWMNEDWLPPHRQKAQKSSLSLMNSPALKMITQGRDVCSGNTSRASSFTEQSQSSALVDSRESSFDVIQSSKPLCDKHDTDDGCVVVKEAQDTKSLKTVSDSTTLDPILTNGRNPEIETLQDSEKDDEGKKNKKQAKIGCFPFFQKRKKKKKVVKNKPKGTQYA